MWLKSAKSGALLNLDHARTIVVNQVGQTDRFEVCVVLDGVSKPVPVTKQIAQEDVNKVFEQIRQWISAREDGVLELDQK